MFSSLPLELILLLLSYLDRKADQDTLRSLSLTSLACLGPCQSIIFYHIKLDSLDSGRRLLSLLSSSPWIAGYVKRVTISDAVDAASKNGWLRADPNLALALRK
jgi:hypothetical protein